MKRRSLTYQQECELYELLELRRSLSLKKLMIRFGVSYAVIARISNKGPSAPRESLNSSMIDTYVQELRG